MHTENLPAKPLHDLVRACMDDIDELIDAFLAELAEIPPYRDELIPLAEVRGDAADSFEMLLRLIAGSPLTGRLGSVSESIGRRRAQAGVPLDVLLRAVRLDFRILWAALIRHADPDDLHALLEGAVTVWEAVERHTVEVHVNYLDEAAVLAREREQERSRILAELLSSDGRDPRVRARTATALEVEPNARFAVAAGRPAEQRALRRATDSLRANGITAHLYVEGSWPVLIAQLPRETRTVPAHWLRGVHCGLGPVAVGLATVPRSVRVGIEIARTLGNDGTGPLRLSQVWAGVAAERLSEPGEALADEVLAALDSASESERDRLIQTANSYFRSGSVAATAQELSCHRNTVLNRVRRLGDLTGDALSRPEHAALVLLALRVRARREHSPAEN